MENNDFDNILRDKMEGFNPKVNPAHVAKTKAFVMSKLATKSVFATTAFWGATSGIAAIVIAGVFYFTQDTKNTNSQKEISIKTTQPSVEKEIITNDTKLIDPEITTVPENEISNPTVKNTEQNPVEPFINKENPPLEKEEDQPKLADEIRKSELIYDETPLKENEKEIIEINSLTFNGFPTVEPNNTCEKVALSYPQKSLKKEDLLVKTKIQYNVGLGYQAKKDGNSFSGLFEVSKKNVMLNAGVQFTKHKPVNYQTKVEFEHKRGHEFRPPPNDRDKNRPRHFHDTNMVKNITQQTNVISIPITLQYKVPVYRGLSIFGGITSRIDVSAKQDITFEYQPNKKLPPITEYSTGKVSVKPINTFQTQLGLQQESGRISLRLFPTYSIHVKKTEYNPVAAKFGVGFQMLYRL